MFTGDSFYFSFIFLILSVISLIIPTGLIVLALGTFTVYWFNAYPKTLLILLIGLFDFSENDEFIDEVAENDLLLAF